MTSHLRSNRRCAHCNCEDSIRDVYVCYRVQTADGRIEIRCGVCTEDLADGETWLR